MYDVLIVGAGVIGAMIARDLARYELNVLVVEKNSDVGDVTSSANSAIVHSGYDPLPGTLKAKLNVKGCSMFPKLCEELDVPFGKCGTLTVVENESQWGLYKELVERSKINGVNVLTLSKEEALAMEPNLNPNILGALFAPDAGIVNPFLLTVNAMENAVDNGVNLVLNEEVISIKKHSDLFVVKTSKNEYKTKCVINAAGLYSDKIAQMVEDISWSITPRKGEYLLLNKNTFNIVSRPIFPLPSEKGKGILVSITTAGNVYVGPSSEPVENKDDYSTDTDTIDYIKKSALSLVPNIPFLFGIRVFSGVRATPSTHDFIIETSKNDPYFINVAGIESPGLASSPAISEYVITNLVSKIFSLKEKDKYNPLIKKHIYPFALSEEELNELIKTDKDYGKIICQCERITLGEIKDALNRSVPPHSIKAVKRRTRAGFGLCQGGYCMSRVIKVLADYYKINPDEVLYDNEGSEVILSSIKENNHD